MEYYNNFTFDNEWSIVKEFLVQNAYLEKIGVGGTLSQLFSSFFSLVWPLSDCNRCHER